ncbi:MAG: hypothetical protein AAGA54_02270 [Myxococcota bacterium]
MPTPSASDTSTRQSLVEEIHLQRQRDVAEAKAGRRRSTRNRIVLVLVSVAALGAAGVVIKQTLDTRRIERGLASAATPLSASSAGTLDAALTVLESNLEVEAQHPETLGRIAIVRTHQAVRGFADRAVAEEALAVAKAAGRPEGPLGEGMLAALDGDFDQARRAYEAAGTADPVIDADAAWLQGMVALGHPYDVALDDDAIARLEASLRETPWVPNLRVLALLVARGGDLDRALELTAQARELAASDVGLSVDEAFFKALKAESVAGVLELVQTLESADSVVGPDVSRLAIAKGLAALHEGEPDDGVEALTDAWERLTTADNDARMHVIEGLLTYGQLERVEALRRDVHLGSQADALFDAWTDLAKGESKKALEALESMPQSLPRVAHLQALALVEVYRYAEAAQWVGYAQERLPDRPDLDVAAARVAVATDADRPTALQALESLAKDHPTTFRVWTGLAQARLSVADPSESQTKEAVEALQEAIEREASPAEASFLLAQHHGKLVFDEPEAGGLALENYRRAAKTAPRAPLHRAAYGAFLAQLARAREAKEVLGDLVDDTSLGAVPLLELARVSSTDAALRGTPVEEGVSTWLAEAAKRGAAPGPLELEWARYEYARRNPQALEQARVRLEALLAANPRDIDVRALYGSTLLALGDTRTAKVSLREGIRRTLRTLDGRLYVVLARAELADGKRRRAASLAYKGWRKMVREPLPVGELLDTAPFVAKLWTDLGQPKAAATVGRGLTFRAPVSPRAWVLRGEIEIVGERPGAACRSADKAVELDEALPSAWGLRGDCLLALESYAEALESYDQAVKLAAGTVAERGFEAKRTAARRRAKRAAKRR